MQNTVEMTEVEVKCSTIIEILSEVIQSYILKEKCEK